jgi:hypothetical protein
MACCETSKFVGKIVLLSDLVEIEPAAVPVSERRSRLERLDDKQYAELTGEEAFPVPGDLTGRINFTEEGFDKVLRGSLEATAPGGRGKAQLAGF